MKTTKTTSKIITIVLFLVLCIPTSFAFEPLVDETELVFPTLKQKIVDFNNEQDHQLGLIVRKKETTNALDDALHFHEKQKTGLMIYYNLESKSLVVVQQKEELIGENTLKELLTKYQEKKNISITDEKTTQETLNSFLGMIITDAILLLKNIDQVSDTCAKIKDGVCDDKCPAIDLDCLCGDGVCQYHETRETCSEDCGQGKTITCSILSDGICSEQCIMKDIDCHFQSLASQAVHYGEQKNIPFKLLTYLFLGLVILLSIVLLILLKIAYKQHKERKEQQGKTEDDFIKRLMKHQEKVKQKAKKQKKIPWQNIVKIINGTKKEVECA